MALYGDALFGFAYARLHNRSEAEDAVQETLLAALAGHDTYRGEASERAWLFGILRHKVMDCLRARRRATPLQSGEDMDAVLESNFDEKGHWRIQPARWAEPDQELEQAQLHRVLVTCLENLPAGLQMVFRLSELDGVSTEDICKVLGITATNVWVRLHRARLRLRDCLDARWFHPPLGRHGVTGKRR